MILYCTYMWDIGRSSIWEGGERERERERERGGGREKERGRGGERKRIYYTCNWQRYDTILYIHVGYREE